MKDELVPLEEDVLAVLRSAAPLDVPDQARARIVAAVAARIASVPPGGGGDRGGSGSDGGGGGSSAPRAIARAPWIASHPLLAVSVAFVAGGAFALVARGSVPERIVYVDRPVAAPASTAIAHDEAPVEAPELRAVPVESLPPAAAPSGSSASPSTSLGGASQALAAESAILDVARTALARGEPDRALVAIDRHAHQFPNGLLREEREALGVKALALAGRGDEARARAARFRQRYPESLFLASIDSSLRSIR